MKTKQNFKTGLFLLEILIAICLLASFIPTIFKTFLFIQKKIVATQNIFITQTEEMFINSFIRADLKTATKIIKISDSQIGFHNNNAEKITYSLKNQRILRKKKRNYFYLNQTLKINSFKSSKENNNLYCLEYDTDTNKRSLIIYLPISKND
jgi:hypothetical protein